MRRVVLRSLILAMVAGCAGGCALEPFSEAGLKVDTPTARIRVVDEDSQPVLLVESAQGIGSCVVTLTDGEWPATVTARFAYGEDRPFTMMEAVTVSNDVAVMTTRLGAAGPVEIHAVGGPGNGAKTFTNDFTVTATADGVEVSLPMAVLRAHSSFELEWVDAYRR